MLRRRKVGRNGDKPFRHLVHDFWTLIVIEHGVEDGLYPRKKRIPVGHIFRVRMQSDTQTAQVPVTIREKRAHKRPQTRPIPRQQACQPRQLFARSLFLSPSSPWLPYYNVGNHFGGLVSLCLPQEDKGNLVNHLMNIDCACETVSSAYDSPKRPSSGTLCLLTPPHPRRSRRNAMQKRWSG